MVQYCPCITQLSHINHCMEPRELLHLKAHVWQRGKGLVAVEVIEGWLKGGCMDYVTRYDPATHHRLVSGEALVR